MDFTTDYFGNKICVGDKIVFAKSEHSSLAIGEVVKIGSKGTSVDVKILVAPFAGYWKEANTRIGEVTKVQLKKTMEESHHHKNEDGQWVVDYYDTDYIYALRYDNPVSREPQYHFKSSKLRD